ncbi:hypothetical protein RSOLAG1IB_07383 [Rhizoctonia solani AG-1 IB]|uniref:Transmembrane protein n=2 Tax=Thanatephorus cucumeris (strain AG1-IB / isolate 7/3/14) TaxID=1108050 RepID=A0A0B7F9Z5_THACB|nr:hypothetical protein RSOLAG1IB_07383 [Rhizoctonia solani AG-1 IB]
MATNRLSFVDLLIFSAPEGESPFAYAANFIVHLLPAKPDWYFKQIIATGVLNAVSFVLTLVSFIIVARRRKLANEMGSLWFFRTRYGHPSRIPYIMPNPLTMFLVWNAIFSILMQPYTWLNYFAWKYPSRGVTSKVYFWYGFVFIFDGAGMWMSAFGTLYATLLPRVLLGSERKVSILLHPVLLNFMCFAMPALLTVTQIVTASLSQSAWSKAVNLQFDLVNDLWTLSDQWLATNGESVDSRLRQEVSVGGNVLMKAFMDSRSAFVRNAWAAAAWYFLCMLLFSPTAIWLLVTLKGAAGHLTQNSRSGSSQSPPSPGPNAAPPAQRIGPPISQPNTSREQSKQKRALRRAYVTAALQFIATFVCLMVAVGSFIWVSIDIDRVATNPVAHAVAILISDWILAVVGTIINILIIIRMTAQVETTGSHPSHHQDSYHTRLRSLSNARTMANRPMSPSHSDLEIEKPIPLHIISTHHLSSEAELGLGHKAPLSSNGGHSHESFAYSHNRI